MALSTNTVLEGQVYSTRLLDGSLFLADELSGPECKPSSCSIRELGDGTVQTPGSQNPSVFGMPSLTEMLGG